MSKKKDPSGTDKKSKEILDKARFAFIKPDTAKLMGSQRTFKAQGQSGMEISDFLPHIGSVADDLLMVLSMHSDEFNHHPGQLQMQCGVPFRHAHDGFMDHLRAGH